LRRGSKCSKTLRSIIERGAGAEHARNGGHHAGHQLHDEVERFERELIGRALELTSGHQVRAARLLGLKRRRSTQSETLSNPLPPDAPRR
jgi:transcriptional regulator with GAF, ATPase, and Fis domain